MPRNRKITNSVNRFAKSRYLITMLGMEGVELWCQKLTIPGVDRVEIEIPTTTGQPMFVHGETSNFGTITGSFIVDEDLKNWKHMYDWANGIGHPEQMSVVLLNNNRKPVMKLLYKFAFPVTIGNMDLAADNDEEEPVLISFEIRVMDVEIIDLTLDQ